MTQYIKKYALVAEIKRRKKIVEKRLYINNSYSEEGNAAWERDKALYDAYNYLLSFLDTLEVKEVDLEKEIINWWDAYYSNKDYTFERYTGHYLENSTLIKIAKHFFELGLKAKEK